MKNTHICSCLFQHVYIYAVKDKTQRVKFNVPLNHKLANTTSAQKNDVYNFYCYQKFFLCFIRCIDRFISLPIRSISEVGERMYVHLIKRAVCIAVHVNNAVCLAVCRKFLLYNRQLHVPNNELLMNHYIYTLVFCIFVDHCHLMRHELMFFVLTNQYTVQVKNAFFYRAYDGKIEVNKHK